MVNSDKASVMKNEIRAVAGYQALLISKYFIILCLFVSAYIVEHYRFAISPVYILLLYLILPPILSFAFKDYSKKYKFKFLQDITKDEPFLLNNLKRKYNYHTLQYAANTFSFYFTLLLIALWQYNLLHMEAAPHIVLVLPGSTFVIGIAIRILGQIIYRIKLPYDISHNKL